MLGADLQNRFKVRPATNRDVPAIKNLVFSVLEEYGLRPDPGSTDLDLEDPEKTYHQQGGAFEVVVERAEGELVGTVGLLPLDEKRVELRKMYLAARVRGLGLGKLLLERSLRQARRLGFQEVWLETNSRLREAIRLYRKFGFRPIEVEHLAARCDQAYVLRLGAQVGGAKPP